MGATPLAAMGIVVAWSSSLLLWLLFIRLGRSGAHRAFVRTWIAAWAVQALAVTGPLIHSLGILSGDPAFGSRMANWADLLLIPGALVFATLAAFGALQGSGRDMSVTIVRAALLASALLGAVLTYLDHSTVTGPVVIAATALAFPGLAVAVARGELRQRPRRLPLLALAMFCFGAIALAYETGLWFGQVLWPLDDFAALAGWSAGYGDALASACLGGALVTVLVDDAFRGTLSARPTSDAALVGSAVPAREHIEVRSPWAPEPVARESGSMLHAEPDVAVVGLPEMVTPTTEIAIIESSRETRGAAGSQGAVVKARTATLPLPPIFAHGRLGEAFIVDDEASVRSMLARIFQRGGWPVRDAATGEEALAWLLDVPADEAPAVILCDFRMSGMGGQEMYGHLMRERPELAARIVFVTGDTTRESARTFIAGTSCQVVEKPFTVSEVATAVEEVLATTLLLAS